MKMSLDFRVRGNDGRKGGLGLAILNFGGYLGTGTGTVADDGASPSLAFRLLGFGFWYLELVTDCVGASPSLIDTVCSTA